MKTKSSIATAATAALLLACDASAVETGMKSKQQVDAWSAQQALSTEGSEVFAESGLQGMIKEQVRAMLAENSMAEATQKSTIEESTHSKSHSKVSSVRGNN